MKVFATVFEHRSVDQDGRLHIDQECGFNDEVFLTVEDCNARLDELNVGKDLTDHEVSRYVGWEFNLRFEFEPAPMTT